MKCLDSQTISDVYTLSLLAYTYTLMDRNGRRRRIVMDRLEQLTISNGDFMIVIHVLFRNILFIEKTFLLVLKLSRLI